MMAQPESDCVGQVIGQARRACLEQRPGIGGGEHVQLLDGIRTSQGKGHAEIARGQEDGAAWRRHSLQHNSDLLAPDIVKDQKQPIVTSEEHLHSIRFKNQLIQPRHAQVAAVGIGHQALEQRGDVIAAARAGTYIYPDDAARVTIGVAGSVHGGQHSLADTSQAPHAHQGDFASLQAAVEIIQFGGAAHSGSGQIGPCLLGAAPGKGQVTHVIDVENSGIIANGAVDSRDDGVFCAAFASQRLTLQPLTPGLGAVGLAFVGGCRSVQRAALTLAPRLLHQRQARGETFCGVGIALLASA